MISWDSSSRQKIGYSPDLRYFHPSGKKEPQMRPTKPAGVSLINTRDFVFFYRVIGIFKQYHLGMKVCHGITGRQRRKGGKTLTLDDTFLGTGVRQL
jgi:hypothetical protein